MDDIPVEKVSKFTVGLRDYLRTSKPKYGEIVQGGKALTDEAEKMLKDGIAEYKQTFLVSA